jgi:hypothetical protein
MPIDLTEELAVSKSRLALAASMIGLSVLMAGCQHYLIAAPGETSVAVYPDEQTYTKIADLKKQGGIGGMIGGLGQNFTAKQIDNNTPVRIVTSDDLGDVIEVIDGPNKGISGFVPKSSVN